MPIYEYECDHCGHHVEVLQKFSDSPITECEQCHSRMKKLISHSTFHLKGTGWYVTDYAKKSGQGTPESKSTSSAESDSTPSASKPEAKASKTESNKTTSSDSKTDSKKKT
ncbi:MAG: FmdB family zinc ribbon protein [Desulfatiglandaceae bacterium]